LALLDGSVRFSGALCSAKRTFLSERPSGVRLALGVSLARRTIIDGAPSQREQMERVERDLRVWESGTDRLLGDDPLHDPPDRVSRDPRQRLHLALGHPLRAERVGVEPGRVAEHGHVRPE
jgi:hypothetical protein